MIKKGGAWILLGAAYAGLLLSPYRRETSHHLRDALGLAWQMDATRLDALLQRFKASPEFHVACAEWSGNLPEAVQHYAQAASRSPRSDMIYASALACYSPHIPHWMLSIRRFRSLRSPPPIEPWQAETLLDAVRSGRLLEPENAYYDYLEASMRVREQNSEGALRLFRQGVEKPAYNPHRKEAFLARLALLEWAGIPSLEAKALILKFPHPQIVKLLELSRYFGLRAKIAEDAGQHSEAVRDYLLLARMSSQIVRNAWSSEELTQGIQTIQVALSLRFQRRAIASRALRRGFSAAEHSQARLARVRAQGIEYVRGYGGRALADRFARDLSALDGLYIKLGRYQAQKAMFRERLSAVQAFRNGQVLLLATAFWLALVAGATAFLRWFNRETLPGLPWKGWRAALLLLPVLLLLTLFSYPMPYTEEFGRASDIFMFEDMLPRQQALVFLGIFAVGGGIAARIGWHNRRKGANQGAFAVFFREAVIQSLPRMVWILLALYLLLWIPAAPFRRQAERSLDKIIDNEARLAISADKGSFFDPT
ncbi:MAG: hypothetical protein IT210_22025 [Armatimonadetes bacterium]|nr:hypothetical protein [Armatimonadota bacterium]